MGRESYELGLLGEEKAEAYLTSLGYVILERNFRCRYGEIDLIAFHRDFLVFVEVKSYSPRSFIRPEQALNCKKRAKLLRAAQVYQVRRGCGRQLARFDLLAIVRRRTGPQYALYQNAFQKEERGWRW